MKHISKGAARRHINIPAQRMVAIVGNSGLRVSDFARRPSSLCKHYNVSEMDPVYASSGGEEVQKFPLLGILTRLTLMPWSRERSLEPCVKPQ
jgi:hypothetical protein